VRKSERARERESERARERKKEGEREQRRIAAFTAGTLYSRIA